MHHFELNKFMTENDLVLSIFKSNRSGMWVASLEKSFAHGLTMKAVNEAESDRHGPTILGLIRRCSFYPMVWALEPAKAMAFLQETIDNYKEEQKKLASVIETVSSWLHEYVNSDFNKLYEVLETLPEDITMQPTKTMH